MDLITFSVTAGVGRTGDNAPITPLQRVTALEVFRAECAETYGGYTETEGSGGWVDPTGALVVEDVVIFTIHVDPNEDLVSVGDFDESIRVWARRLGHLLNQHSVVLRYGSLAGVLEVGG